MRPGAALPPAARRPAASRPAGHPPRTGQPVPGRPVTVRGLRLVTGFLAAAATLAGCSPGDPTRTPAPATSAAPPATATAARGQLAGLAAAAEDYRFTALYSLSTPGRPERTVVVTAATDGSWRVDIPGGALGGTADVAVAQNSAGLFQCALPSAQRPAEAACVRVADPGGRVPARADPRVQHPFTDWVDVLTDRQAPLSVSAAPALSGTRGECFVVESISASMTAPLDVGVYCFAKNGLLTGAKLQLGTLRLIGEPAAPPRSVTLPGPVVPGNPLGMATPPPPPTPTATIAATGAPTISAAPG
ncbi:MAG TPA: hypothetical protein VF755_11180 [Catenuloplanes sp.]